METVDEHRASVIFAFEHKMHNSINLFGIEEVYFHQVEIRLRQIIKVC